MVPRFLLPSRSLLPALILSLLPSGLLPGAEASASTSEPGLDDGLTAWITGMDRFFGTRPDYVERPGHGWKPFQRIRWFHEQRMVDGVEPPVGARWRAWEQRQQRQALRARSFRSTWFALGPANLAGRMLALEFHPTSPDTLYAGAAGGGLWKSTDGGGTWSPLTDDLPTLAVGGVAVVPTDPDVVVIGTGEATFNVDRIGGVGILRSTDGGATWNTTSLSYGESSGHGFHFVEANPIHGTLLAGATNGLWRSSDAGETWVQMKVGGDYYDGRWKPGSADSVFVAKGRDASGNNVKVSTDDGLTWAKAGIGQPGSLDIGKTKIAMSPQDPNTIYAIYSNRSTYHLLGVYRSTDGGANWILRATTPNIPGGQGWYNLSLVADPDDADVVIAGGVALYRSTDGGVTFTGTGGGVHVDHHDAVYRPGAGDNVFVATDGGIWESTDDGLSWSDRNAGLVTYQFYDICVNNHDADPDFIMGGTQDQGTDRWSGTSSWGEGLGGDGMVCNINPLNGRTVYAEMQKGDHRKNTASGLGPWTSINSGITGEGLWVTPVDEDQNAGNHLYTSSSDGIFRTTTGGSSWTKVADHTALWISISPVDGDVVWTASAVVWRTTDDGASWSPAASFMFSHGTVTKILAHPVDVNSAFVTFSGYAVGDAHVALTTDGGGSWQDVTGNLPDQPVNAIAVAPGSPNLWFVGTDIGVWNCTDGGASWSPCENGLPNAVIADLEIQVATHKLFAGTHGRGAWELDFGPLLDLEPEDGPDVDVRPPSGPPSLMLDRPYPNPVVDATTFRYAANSSGEVVLEIYDVRGRLVSEVARLSRGDGIVRNGRWWTEDLPDGVYFAVLRAGEARTSRKVIVAR
jgi:hypothetical protein